MKIQEHNLYRIISTDDQSVGYNYLYKKAWASCFITPEGPTPWKGLLPESQPTFHIHLISQEASALIALQPLYHCYYYITQLRGGIWLNLWLCEGIQYKPRCEVLCLSLPPWVKCGVADNLHRIIAADDQSAGYSHLYQQALASGFITPEGPTSGKGLLPESQPTYIWFP